ncbi:MAG: hypothetical protein J6Y02_09990 [Pseudobutyrivibrio sp.]|nr:hypothetical protein [Pseudobutyrivibrio sp.]
MTVPGALLNLIQHAEKAAEVLVENMAVYVDSFNEDTKEYELTIFPLDKEEYLYTYQELDDYESKLVYQAWFVSGLASEGKLPDELVYAIIDYVYNRQVVPDVDHRVERGDLREYLEKKEKIDES